MDYITGLKKAIRKLHGCEAEYLETVPVAEFFQGKAVWQGNVEVFAIRGHPKAKRAYAWTHKSEKGKRHFAVLELPPVESAETAVRASIIAERKHDK